MVKLTHAQKIIDLDIKVTPELTNAYLTLTTILSGPLAGLTAYLANSVLNSVIDIPRTLLSYSVDISGSYDNPVVSEQ